MTTIFMIGLSIYSYVQINNLFESSKIIYHTNNVQNALGTISKSLVDAETNNRGFLLIRDSLMLQKRDKALISLAKGQQYLDSLISGNADKIRYAAKLYQVIEERKVNIEKATIESISLDIPSNIKENIYEGSRIMDSVNELVEEMNREESSLLERRTALFTRLSQITPFYIIVLFLGSLIILLFSYFKLNKELIKSQDLHAALVLQDEDRELLASKLILANEELAFQNAEKEKRASELAVANLELEFQNKTKEKLASELIIANHELAFQNEEKENRAAELVAANKELELFINISSHDLQEPLRKIQMAASRIESNDYMALSSKGRDHFVKMQEAALSMHTLIEDLLIYSRTNSEERIFEDIDLTIIINEVRNELKESIEEKNAVIEVMDICNANIMRFQFRQLVSNIISNALKFTIPGQPPHIIISSNIKPGSQCHNESLIQDQQYCHIRIADNGIGFEPQYNEKIFEVFQRLYSKETYKGTGIGLAMVKKIVENHNGVITATGHLNKGAIFDIYIPTIKKPKHG
ncbi:MAG: ATP-binding protein [Saprospiraceae bacterium]|nr:ATP-binding protein [Saprospiraceae bacterium]